MVRRVGTREALRLLSLRDRCLLGALVVAQFLLAFLDLAGVILIGVVAALAASDIAGPSADLGQSFSEPIGLADVISRFSVLELAIAAACLLVLKSVLSFFVLRRTLHFLAQRQAVISHDLASRLLAQSLLFTHKRSSQEASYALVSGVNAAILGVIGNTVIVLSEVALIGVLIIGLLFVDTFTTLFTLIFFAFLATGIQLVFSKRAAQLGFEVSRADVLSIELIQGALRMFRELLVSGRGKNYSDKFFALRTAAAKSQADHQLIGQVPKYVFEVGLVVGAALLVFSQLEVNNPSSAIGIIVLFLAASSRLLPALLRLQSALLSVRTSAGAATFTLSLSRDLREEECRSIQSMSYREPPGALLATGIIEGHAGFDPHIELRNVGLWYPEAQAPAVSGITLSIKSGSSLALVGNSGAGKTSIADMVMGAIAPTSGSITLGDLAPNVAVENFPGALGYVPQDISLVNGSIAQNVAYGLPPDLVFEDLIWEALHKAQLSSFLHAERDGLQTEVGEHGMMLSGGQRQRLGLARVFYTRPKLLVLDEATSALDSDTEASVTEELRQRETSITLIVIAHRLSTVRDCDQVAFIDHGKLRAIGTFDEVRREAPAFDRQAQLSGL